MGPLGWMTVGVFVLLPYYATKYTLVAMWWTFVVGPVKLWQAVAEWRERKAKQAVPEPWRPGPSNPQGTVRPPVVTEQQQTPPPPFVPRPWPGASKQPAPPRDWSSQQ